MPSICCILGCYNRKLCENKPISFFENTGANVDKKMTYQVLMSIKEYNSQFGVKISKYLNYFFCSWSVNFKNIKD